MEIRLVPAGLVYTQVFVHNSDTFLTYTFENH